MDSIEDLIIAGFFEQDGRQHGCNRFWVSLTLVYYVARNARDSHNKTLHLNLHGNLQY